MIIKSAATLPITIPMMDVVEDVVDVFDVAELIGMGLQTYH